MVVRNDPSESSMGEGCISTNRSQDDTPVDDDDPEHNVKKIGTFQDVKN